MNEIATKPAPNSLLQKLREMSLPTQQNQEILPLVTSKYADEIRQMYPSQAAVYHYADTRIQPSVELSTEYENIYSPTVAMMLAASDIDLGATASLSHVENPSLVDMRSAYGGKAVVRWLRAHLNTINATSGASNKMDELAIDMCARDIVTSFPYLRLTDICVFCVRMRSLKYVERRSDYVFSQDTIMKGLREFDNDRLIEIDRYEREHPAPPSATKGNPCSREQAMQSDDYKAWFPEGTQHIASSPDPVVAIAKVAQKVDVRRPTVPPAHTKEELEEYKRKLKQNAK